VGKDAVYTCCPSHGAGSLDPHWWHGIDNTRRAARVVAQAFAEKDPLPEKTYYNRQRECLRQAARALKKWAKSELGKVPRGQRKLVTAHNAFGYFAKEFGFEVIAVAGLNKEQNTTPQEQAKTIESVKKSGVRAVFPELGSSTRCCKRSPPPPAPEDRHPLIADGNGTGSEAGFEAMIRHNVNAITRALPHHERSSAGLHPPGRNRRCARRARPACHSAAQTHLRPALPRCAMLRPPPQRKFPPCCASSCLAPAKRTLETTDGTILLDKIGGCRRVRARRGAIHR
jgi:hypothetical protein